MASITYTNKVNATVSDLPDVNKITAADMNEIKASVNALYATITSGGNELLITSVDDLPAVVNGYHQIPADTVLNFKVQEITLTNGLEFLGIGMIKGSSSETTNINATVNNKAFIKTAFSLPVQNISFNVSGTNAVIFDIDGDGVNNAYDWFFTNFHGNAKLGVIGDASNFIFFSCAFFNTGAGIEITGSIATFSMDTVLFTGQTGYSLKVASTATITRRLRVATSSFVTLSGNESINFSTSASVPVESYILNGVNFAGGGTYLAGVIETDNKSLFTNCKGITNSTSIVNMFIKNNVTPTVVTVQGTRYAITGTSEVGAIIQRFIHDVANNAVQYKSTVKRVFKVSATGSLTAAQNNVIGVYLGVNRNGNGIDPTADRISESEVYVTSTSTRPDTFAIQALVELNENDKVYGIVQNTSGTNNITVNFFNLIIETAGN